MRRVIFEHRIRQGTIVDRSREHHCSHECGEDQVGLVGVATGNQPSEKLRVTADLV